MRRFIRRFGDRLGSGSRAVVAITTGSVLGQLILILVTPFLSRIYAPESFGILSVMLAIAAVLGPTATLKLESALLLPKEDDGARRLLRLALVSSFLVAFVAGLFVWLVPTIGDLANVSSIAFAPFWVAGMVLASSTFSVLSQAALRERRYSTIAKRSITQSAGMALGQVGLGLITATTSSLLGGYLFGRTVGYIPLIRASRNLFKPPTTGSYRTILKEYWRFPIVFTTSGLLNALGSQIPLIIIAAWFGAAGAGQMGMAQRLVFIPVTLLGASLGQVFGAELSRRLRERTGGFTALYVKISTLVGLLAAVVTILLLLLSPLVLPLILGENWAESGYLAQAMAVSVGLGLVVSPLSKVYMIFQRSFASIVVDISRICLLFCAAVVAFTIEADIVATTWLLYGGQAVNYVITWAWGFRIAGQADSSEMEEK